jgi:aquaporin related protein
MFLFFAFCGASGGVVAAGTSMNSSTTIYISLAFGFSLLVNAWIFFRISGSLFNPAVSLAMCIVGQIKPLRFFPSRGF